MNLYKSNFFAISTLAFPLALAGLGQAAGFFFDTLFLAHLGPTILAAGALVGWLFSTFAVILFGTLSSINVLVSHQHGANNQHAIALITRDGLWLACVLSVFSFVLFWNIPPLFLLLGQPFSIVLLAKSYLHALAWGFLPYFMTIALLDVMLGIGETKLVLVFGSIAVLLKILFAYGLIFGKAGLPALGIAGAGWGMSISAWLTFILLFLYSGFHKKYRVYFYFIVSSTTQSYILKLIQVGLPMGFMYCVEVGFFFVMALLIGAMGSQLLAANQVAMQYLGLLINVIFSIAQAITIRMGHLLGAGEVFEAKYAGYAGISLSFLFMIMVALVYWCFPTALISIDFDIQDPNNANIVAFSIKFLALCAVFQVFEAVRISLFGALRALHDTRYTLCSSIFSFWGIALPMGYLLASSLKIGVIGYWWGLVLSAGFNALLLIGRFKSKINKYGQLE